MRGNVLRQKYSSAKAQMKTKIQLSVVRKLCGACLFLIVSLVPPTACAEKSTPPESWWNPPSDPYGSHFYQTQIPAHRVSVVQSKLQARAQALLVDRSLLPITRIEANRWGDTPIGTRSVGIKYYLVRAVRCTGGGSFAVFRHGASIYVTHGDLATQLRMARSALVVGLPGPVEHVFVDCGIAE